MKTSKLRKYRNEMSVSERTAAYWEEYEYLAKQCEEEGTPINCEELHRYWFTEFYKEEGCEIMKSPIFDANPFGTDEEMELWDKQNEAFNNFYQNLLPKVSAMQWTDGRKTMIFSRDTISNLAEYRVSAFDEKGAIYHVSRETIERLLHAEQFPCDGRELKIVY